MAQESAYQKLIREWYGQKPKTPGIFTYSKNQEAADTRSVQEQYRPAFQEKIDYSNEQFQNTLKNAQQGYSRRNLWGAAAPQPVPGSTLHTTGAQAPQQDIMGGWGPVSSIRRQGEQQIGIEKQRASTAFERQYNEAVAGGVQQRQAEAQDVYQKTIRDPYEQQFRDWQNRFAILNRGY